MAINENGVQVERQYIGARYVPKFFQGVNGSPEWVAGLAYEALTIVTYLGNSFTSKVPVPAGIGNPADNPTYWVNTGNYNAQVDAYREEVAETKTEIENLQTALNTETQTRETADSNLQLQITTVSNEVNRLKMKEVTSNSRIIFVTDSYGSYPSESDNWITRLAAELGVANYIKIARGSTGFTTTPSWQSMVEGTTIESPETISHIIVGGGSNDASLSTENNITLAAANFITYCKNRFPNAEIVLAPFGYGYTVNGDKTWNMLSAYRKACSRPGTHYVDNICYVLHNIDLLIANTVHPNSEGVNQIVLKMCEWINTGSCSIFYRQYAKVWKNPLGSSIEATVNEIMHNGMWSASIYNLTVDTKTTIKVGRNGYTRLNDNPFKFCLGNQAVLCYLTGMVKIEQTPNYLPATFWLESGDLILNVGYSSNSSPSTVSTTLNFGTMVGTAIAAIA